MANVLYNPGFSQVYGNYGGSVSVPIGATSATITPTRASAASIWMDLVALATVTHGAQFEGFVNDSGALVIQTTGDSFTLTASANTQTRLNLAASATGTSITGSGAHQGGLYPTGFKFSGFYLSKGKTKGSAAGDGANPLVWGTDNGTVEILDTYENIWNYHETVYPSGDLYVADIWMGGRSFGRYQITNASMQRPGWKPDPAILRVTAQGVEQ